MESFLCWEGEEFLCSEQDLAGLRGDVPSLRCSFVHLGLLSPDVSLD